MVPPMFTRIPSGTMLNGMINLIEENNNVLSFTYLLVYMAINMLIFKQFIYLVGKTFVFEEFHTHSCV